MELKTQSISNGNISILALSGRFDAYEVNLVKSWLNEQANMSNPHIIVNLSNVNFIDSTGLAALVQGMKYCRQKNGNLYLCGLQQPVRIIFELTRLDKAFDIYNEEDDAIKAFL